ncbi:MAG: VIT domain-containing protein [Planctomycetota bacterium]
MRCHDARGYLGSYALGEVEGWALESLEGHLESCEACRGELEEMEAVVGHIFEVAGGQAPKTLGPLPERVTDPVGLEPAPTSPASWPTVVLIAASLLLFGLAAAWVWTQAQSEPNGEVEPFRKDELASQMAERVGRLDETLEQVEARKTRLEIEGKAFALEGVMDAGATMQRSRSVDKATVHDRIRPTGPPEELSEAVRSIESRLEEIVQLESADEVVAIEAPTDSLQTKLAKLGYVEGEKWGEVYFARDSIDAKRGMLPETRQIHRFYEAGRESGQQAQLGQVVEQLGKARKKTPQLQTITGGLRAQLDASVSEGALRAKKPGGDVIGLFPLEHTDVRAEISGFLAETRVRQTFGNPYSEVILAVYVFPLPTTAAINGFVMQIGERKIVGVVRPKEEAQRIYQEAKARGQTASLLTQERTNIFTQSVANIEPGGTVDVDITYFHPLDYSEGQYEYVFPMVVGPRYIPGSAVVPEESVETASSNDEASPPGGGTSPDTDQVPDASRVSPPVLKDGERSGHDITLSITIDAGVLLGDVTSPTHDILVEPLGAERARIELARHDSIPNRDFVLRYRVSGPAMQLGLLAHRQEELGGFFSLMIVPQLAPEDADVTPREITFVLDNSGSMNGFPIELSKGMVRRTLKSLRPQDRFNIIQFAGSASQLASKSLANNEENVRRGLEYLNGMKGSGGTEMLKGVQAFLDSPVDENHIQMVCFLTDGFVGNEDAILRLVQEKGQHARWYAFGVGSSVNRMLIEGIAKVGRGRSTEILPTEDEAAKKASDRFFDFMDSPVLTDIELDWNGLPVMDVFPSQPRDLFAGEPIVLVGRYSQAAEGQLIVKGRAGTRATSLVLPISLPESSEAHAALAPVWARSQITQLTEQLLGQPENAEEIRTQIRDLAVDFQLVSQYTSFIAVDESRVVGDGRPLTVLQPVEVPLGVNRDSAVGEEPTGIARRIEAWGVTLVQDQSGELRVGELDEDRPLQRVADVSTGEVLCALNGIELRGFGHLESLLLQASGETVELSFRPAGDKTATRRTVTVPRP